MPDLLFRLGFIVLSLMNLPLVTKFKFIFLAFQTFKSLLILLAKISVIWPNISNMTKCLIWSDNVSVMCHIRPRIRRRHGAGVGSWELLEELRELRSMLKKEIRRAKRGQGIAPVDNIKDNSKRFYST